MTPQRQNDCPPPAGGGWRRAGRPAQNKTARQAGPCSGTRRAARRKPAMLSRRTSFWRSSRRCWASSDSVAVGRASRRGTPIGSPVSSHQPYSPDSMRDGACSTFFSSCARDRGCAARGMLFLDGGAVGRIRHDDRFAQVLRRLVGVLQDVVAQLFKAMLEESELRFIHVILVAHLQDFEAQSEVYCCSWLLLILLLMRPAGRGSARVQCPAACAAWTFHSGWLQSCCFACLPWTRLQRRVSLRDPDAALRDGASIVSAATLAVLLRLSFVFVAADMGHLSFASIWDDACRCPGAESGGLRTKHCDRAWRPTSYRRRTPSCRTRVANSKPRRPH